MLKYHRANIVLLQETHSVTQDEKVWSNEWGSKIYFCHGSNLARGVATMFSKNFPVTVEYVKMDIYGRYLVMDVKIGDFSFILANVYGPNDDNPDFFVNYFNIIESRDNASMLLAGDFNLTMQPELDLYNNTGSTHVKKRLVTQEFVEAKDLVDVWRLRNPNSRVFSWRKPTLNKLVMSRLDYFFLSQDLVNRTKGVEIKTRYNSDHCRIEMCLDLSIAPRVKGIGSLITHTCQILNL